MSYQESILNKHFVLLPANIKGHLALFETITLEKLNDFKEIKKQYETQDSKTVEPNSISEIQDYLGDDLFLWFCAINVYPKVEWEVILAIGKDLEELYPPFVERDVKLLNFNNLIKLSQLIFFKTNEVPDKIKNGVKNVLEKNKELEKTASAASGEDCKALLNCLLACVYWPSCKYSVAKLYCDQKKYGLSAIDFL